MYYENLFIHNKTIFDKISMTTITKGFCKKTVNPEHEDGRYSFLISDSMSDVEAEWSVISESKDIFFSPPFLTCIEKCPATGIKPYYCVVRDSHKTIGIIYFQSKYVKLKENLRKAGPDSDDVFNKILTPLRNILVNSLEFQTLVCGNLLLTGKYGMLFEKEISNDTQMYLVTRATEKLNLQLRKSNTHTDLILIKDFFEHQLPLEINSTQSYTQFSVQPKMILKLDPNWKTFDDYMEALKSKYRVRARKALQKSSELTKKEFQVQDIMDHRDIIHQLYKNISDQAGFNAFILHPQYFENLKSSLGDKIKFVTWWKKDTMIAFHTSIQNLDVLDAHFLGYDPAMNEEYQIYLNMLYELTQEGIHTRSTIVDMSRTAVEIKSTVGAHPEPMFLYLKHTKPVINKAVNLVLNLVKPDQEFVIRSPFRE